MVAGVDANGKITAYKAASWTPTSGSGEPSLIANGLTPVNPVPTTGGNVPGNALLGGFYTVPTGLSATRGMKTDQRFRESYLRAPGEPQAFFAGDQTADMLANAIKMDPIKFRKLNTKTASDIPLLTKLQEIMEWEPRVAASQLETGNVVHGRGVSLGNAPGGGFVVGGVHVEVNKKSGKITVQKVWVVQDNGLSVNVASVENQISGCIVQGVSRALHENTSFSSARQTSVDWVTYPILRFKDTPTVTTVTMPNIGAVHGSGEPGSVPMPAAVANAFFDATGVRAFQYPMTSGYIRQILAQADKGITAAPFGMVSGTTLDSPGFK
jgi:CO/xanthine dehydrogenase Mo-binding subunit